MDYSAFLGAAAAALVLLIGKGIEWYRARSAAIAEEKKQDSEERLKEEKQRADVSIPVNEQAVRIYRDLINDLRTDMNKLVENMDTQDAMLLKCREEKVELRAEKTVMAAELESVKRRLLDFEARMAAQEEKR